MSPRSETLVDTENGYCPLTTSEFARQQTICHRLAPSEPKDNQLQFGLLIDTDLPTQFHGFASAGARQIPVTQQARKSQLLASNHSAFPRPLVDLHRELDVRFGSIAVVEPESSPMSGPGVKQTLDLAECQSLPKPVVHMSQIASN